MEKNIEYLFSINTGRSGSYYLYNLFNHVADCQAFHEASPVCYDHEMRCFLSNDLTPMNRLMEQKVQAIQKSKKGAGLYVETNNTFIKGFGWLLPKHLSEENIGVIILKREPAKIAKSFLRIGASPLTRYGRDWLITPDIPTPCLPPPKLFLSAKITYHLIRPIKFFVRAINYLAKKYVKKEFKTPQWLANYELECLEWYVNETYARAKLFKKQFPNIKYYEVDIKDLNSYESVKNMLSYFGCIEKESIRNLIGKKSNLKLKNPNSIHYSELKARIQERQKK